MTIPVTLESVASAFNHWRETRTSPKAAVPDALREQAIELLNHHKLSQVITSLKINHSMLKRWRGIDGSSKITSFVPLQPDKSGSHVASILEITLLNGSGCEMRVKGDLTPDQLAHLMQAFIHADAVSL